MPTINQILRHGRKNKKRKPKAPVLLVRTNTLKKKNLAANSPQKRGVCTRVGKMKKKTSHDASEWLFQKYQKISLIVWFLKSP